jgi:hypothetical protein
VNITLFEKISEGKSKYRYNILFRRNIIVILGFFRFRLTFFFATVLCQVGRPVALILRLESIT